MTQFHRQLIHREVLKNILAALAALHLPLAPGDAGGAGVGPGGVGEEGRAEGGAAPGGERKMKSGKGREYIFQNFTMDELAMELGHPRTSRPVVNRTGLAGAFDFTLDINPYLPEPDAIGKLDTEIAMMRALKEQLGLELKGSHIPVSVLVVDRLEKVPTGNDAADARVR